MSEDERGNEIDHGEKNLLLPTVRRRHAQRKFYDLLRTAVPEQLLSIAWALDALRQGNLTLASRVIVDIPAAAADQSASSPYSIPPWELETLVNERLTTATKYVSRRGQVGTLDLSRFTVCATLINALRSLEDAEAGVMLVGRKDIDFMASIAHRQFPWQRGFATTREFFRAGFLYNFQAASEYVHATAGLTISQFVRIGFAVNSHVRLNPGFHQAMDLRAIGVSDVEFDAFCKMVSGNYDVLAKEALRLRTRPPEIAYRMSVLRRSPCIRIGNSIHVPLPELLSLRITDGLYYDVVGARDKEIRNEVASRFEDYCVLLLGKSFPEFSMTREASYFGDRYRTPDIRIERGGQTETVIECKSKRMTFAAKFDRAEPPVGRDEVVKGVFQCWKYFALVREGRLEREAHISDSASGLVLTLDDWTELAGGERAAMIADAHRLADEERSVAITNADRRPIAFCSIADMEALVSRSTPETFLDTTRRAAEPDYIGWHLTSLHQRLHAEREGQQRGYAFHDELPSVFPWWSQWERA